MADYRLIVGLGNPGKQYEATRHNLGFLIVRELAKTLGLKLKRSLFFKSYLAQGAVNGQNVFLLLPLTYMNNSGVAVRAFVHRKKINLDDILVVCDDLDLDFDTLRLKRNGSGAGHKGLNSLIAHLGSKDFARLRLGIGRPESKDDTIDYVLQGFDSKEKKELNRLILKAVDCCKTWLMEGTEKAMSGFNKKNEE